MSSGAEHLLLLAPLVVQSAELEDSCHGDPAYRRAPLGRGTARRGARRVAGRGAGPRGGERNREARCNTGSQQEENRENSLKEQANSIR